MSRGVPPAPHGGPDGGDPARLDFSTCVNAFGPAPQVRVAARDAAIDAYPDPRCTAVKAALAVHHAVPEDEVICGAGAVELILAAAFARLQPGDQALVCAPAFGEYARAAALCGARVHEIRETDPEAIIAAVGEGRPAIVFLACPTSPLGHRYDADALRAVADACETEGALLLIDQSYDGFLEAPLGTPALPGHPAVLALRSMTKDHALAGLRAAFATGPRRTVAAMEEARMPWSVSAPAQAAMIAALRPESQAFASRTIAVLRSERLRLEREFARLGLATMPTATHYFVALAPGLAARLRAEHGIAVRDCASFGLPACIRVAARTPSDNDQLLAALAALLH